MEILWKIKAGPSVYDQINKWTYKIKTRLKYTFLLILTSLLMVISIIFMISVGVLLFFMNDSLCFPLSRVSFIPLKASRTWTQTILTRIILVSGKIQSVLYLHYRVLSTRQYSAGSSTCLLGGYHPAMETVHYHMKLLGNTKKRISSGFWYFFVFKQNLWKQCIFRILGIHWHLIYLFISSLCSPLLTSFFPFPLPNTAAKSGDPFSSSLIAPSK